MINQLMSSEIAIQMLSSSLFHGTVLAIVTWILCTTIFRNARPAVHAVLWTIVLVKFLVPPVLPGSIGLSRLLEDASYWPIASTGLSQAPADNLQMAVSGTTPALSSEKDSNLLAGFDRTSIARILVSIYLGLLALIVAWLIPRMLRTRRYLRSLPEASRAFSQKVEKISRRLGLKRPPEIKICKENVSPFIIGLLNPKLVVPNRLTRDMDDRSMEALIVHELAHIKRGDLFVRIIQSAAQLLFFFWPPVRWVCRKTEYSAELACDQWAVAFSQVPPGDYARSLLEVARKFGNTESLVSPLAFTRKGRFLEERFKMILRGKKIRSPKVTWLMVPAILAWALFSLSGGVAASQEKGELEKKVQKTVVLKTGPKTDDFSIPASVFPEADLDGDGQLSFDELQAYHEVYPDAFELEVEENADGSRVIKLVLTSEGEGKTLVEGMSDFTSNDQKVIKIHKHAGGEGKELHAVVEAVPDPESKDAKFNIFISEDGEHHVVHKVVEEEGEDGKVVKHIRIHKDYTDDPALILERHPEADQDGDGILSEKEMKQFLEFRDQEQSAMIFINEEGKVQNWDVKHKKIHMIRISENDIAAYDQDGDGKLSESEMEALKTDQMSWQADDGTHHVVKGEGEYIFITVDGEHVDLDGDSDYLVIKKSEFGSQVEKGSVQRKKDFLKDHPEADLDGDGTISKEEAQAYAAKLQEKRKAGPKKEQ